MPRTPSRPGRLKRNKRSIKKGPVPEEERGLFYLRAISSKEFFFYSFLWFFFSRIRFKYSSPFALLWSIVQSSQYLQARVSNPTLAKRSLVSIGLVLQTQADAYVVTISQSAKITRMGPLVSLEESQ